MIEIAIDGTAASGKGTLGKKLSDKYDLNLIPFLLDGVALNPELNLYDGMHPNEKGIIIISGNIEK